MLSHSETVLWHELRFYSMKVKELSCNQSKGVSVEQILARPHVRQTLRRSAKSHFLQFDGSNGQVTRMEWRKMGGIVLCRVHVDVYQGCSVRWTQEKPTIGHANFIESVSWVIQDFLWDHEWITETKVTMKETLILEILHHDIEVPCPLQWSVWWFSAPTNLNRKFVNNRTRVAKFRDTDSSAIELTCNIAHTPRKYFLTVTILLCYAFDKDGAWSAGVSALRGGAGPLTVSQVMAHFLKEIVSFDMFDSQHAHKSSFPDVHGQGGRMEWWKIDWTEICCVYEDWLQIVHQRVSWCEPSGLGLCGNNWGKCNLSGLGLCGNNWGKCNLGDWNLFVEGQWCSTWRSVECRKAGV